MKTLTWKSGKLLKAVFKGKGATILTYDLQLGVDQGTGRRRAAAAATAASACAAAPTDGHDGSDGRKFLGKGAELHGAAAVPDRRQHGGR